MERRNSPTPINYLPQANGNIDYLNSNMRGIQIKQPFQSGSLENTLLFNFATTGYKNIKFACAVLDEGAATGINIDYATNPGSPNWITAGLSPNVFSITNAYQRIEADFSSIVAANDNPDFKVRLRFTGPNMTADTGERVTFNNISVEGVAITLNTDENELSDFIVYPNPVTDVVHIVHPLNNMEYKIFGIDGKLIQLGKPETDEINLTHLPSGLYLLQLHTDDGKVTVRKILKK
jgi:hypothetical protein